MGALKSKIKLMQIVIEIATESHDWDLHADIINKELFTKLTSKILSRYPNFSSVYEIELSILLTDNNRMLELNQEFREKTKPTNVLSFPDIEIDWRNILAFKPNNDYMYLGDIGFGYETIKEEAQNKSISFYDHFCHLAIHAILHLLGYNHILSDEAEIMENIEIELLNSFDIKSPY